MLENLKDFIKGDTSLRVNKGGEPSSKDLQVATGVLLLEMAGADQDYAPEEVRTIFSTMEKQFNISDSETLDILESADQMRQQEGKFDEFVNVINENFSDKQKMLLLAMIWKVILADELVERFRPHAIRQGRKGLCLRKGKQIVHQRNILSPPDMRTVSPSASRNTGCAEGFSTIPPSEVNRSAE